MKRFLVSSPVLTLLLALPIWALSQPTPIPPEAARPAADRSTSAMEVHDA